MAVCSTTALRKYLTQRSNLGQPLREKAVSTTRGHAEGETLITSGAYRRPLFKSSQTSTLTQAGVIRRPVRHLTLLARDVVAAGLVQLEGQGKHPRSEEGAVLPHPALSTNHPADPCTTATAGLGTAVE